MCGSFSPSPSAKKSPSIMELYAVSIQDRRRYRTMFIPNVSWQCHDEYRTNVKKMMKKLSRNAKYQSGDYEAEKMKLLNLNLDPAGRYAADFYSPLGRPIIHQAQILRSMILFAFLFDRTDARTSLTAWVKDVLPKSIVLTVLTGCSSFDELPPLGSCYDLMHRFWNEDRSRYAKNFPLPAGKNGKKPQKTIAPDGKLLEEEEKTATGPLVDNILAGIPVTRNPEGALQDIFFLSAVLPSIQGGLLSMDGLTVSGDGTPLVSHSTPVGHHIKKESDPEKYEAFRHYPDPDACWEWDSSKKTWYFGYNLYMLCSRNRELAIDLPLSMKVIGTRHHDSINFLYSIDEFTRHSPGISPKNLCLDSAHDNIPTCRLLNEWGIHALIDINGRARSSDLYPDDITFDKEGHPLCRNGCRMVPWGNDPVKDAHKYRCPLKCGRIDSCPYEADCSPGSYGRTAYIKNHGDLRFHPAIPRDSDQFKDIYKDRSGCERVNNRFLNDYRLQHLKIRGIGHFSFWTMILGICIHLDARAKAASVYKKENSAV